MRTKIGLNVSTGLLAGGNTALASTVLPFNVFKRHLCWPLGIEPLEVLPEQITTTLHHSSHTVQQLTSSNATLEHQISKLEDAIKGVELRVRSHVTDSLAESLQIQGRRGSTGLSLRPVGQKQFAPHPSLIIMLRNFLSDSSATFKTPEQAEALEVSMACDRHLLLVGPTSMGKSLVYMLPAACRNSGTTCVILPLSALHYDFNRRCRDLKVECSRWMPGTQELRTRIVFVSPEHAQTMEFLNYLTGMSQRRLLVQIVFDEVHLLTQHTDFWFCTSQLAPLVTSGERGFAEIMLFQCGLNINLGVPFLLMTATCPPPLRQRLLSTVGIDDCHILHAPTDRPEISYIVKLSGSIKEAGDSLVKMVSIYMEKFGEGPSFRGLVYCRTKDEVDGVAKKTGFSPFHADRPAQEREASFKDWVTGKKKFMICSSLLGCGVDVKGVRVVLHLGTPRSVLDFAQESGRAGRDGHFSQSIVFASTNEKESSGEEDLYGGKIMREWVLQDTVCRRLGLSLFLDNRQTTCLLLKGAALCDVCKAEAKNSHPTNLTELPALEVPGIDLPKMIRPHVPLTSVEYKTACNQSMIGWVFNSPPLRKPLIPYNSIRTQTSEWPPGPNESEPALPTGRGHQEQHSRKRAAEPSPR